MKTWDPGIASGVFGVVVCALVGAPVAAGIVSGQEVTEGPGWLWLVLFAAFLLCFLVNSWLVDLFRPVIRWFWYTAHLLLGPALLLLAPEAGWLPILVVFTTALSTYCVGRRATVVVLALNTAAITGAAVLAGGSASSVLVVAAIYAAIQVATVLSAIALQRETELRRQLTVAHLDLQATSALLAEHSKGEERLRIARDLHDALGHQLTVLALQLEAAAHSPDDDVRGHVGAARRTTKELLSEVRSTVSKLRAVSPDLPSAVRALAAAVPEPRIDVTVADTLLVDESTAELVIRAAQEIITNTVRHASARTLRLTVGERDGELEVTAVDDGIGGDTSRAGNGLTGLAERVAECGGTVTVDGSDGWRVMLRVPLP